MSPPSSTACIHRGRFRHVLDAYHAARARPVIHDELITKRWLKPGVSNHARISIGPPAGYPTTMRTGFVGYVCACTDALMTALRTKPSAPAAPARTGISFMKSRAHRRLCRLPNALGELLHTVPRGQWLHRPGKRPFFRVMAFGAWTGRASKLIAFRAERNQNTERA